MVKPHLIVIGFPELSFRHIGFLAWKNDMSWTPVGGSRGGKQLRDALQCACRAGQAAFHLWFNLDTDGSPIKQEIQRVAALTVRNPTRFALACGKPCPRAAQRRYSGGFAYDPPRMTRQREADATDSTHGSTAGPGRKEP